jgi:hypothetical protein
MYCTLTLFCLSYTENFSLNPALCRSHLCFSLMWGTVFPTTQHNRHSSLSAWNFRVLTYRIDPIQPKFIFFYRREDEIKVRQKSLANQPEVIKFISCKGYNNSILDIFVKIMNKRLFEDVDNVIVNLIKFDSLFKYINVCRKKTSGWQRRQKINNNNNSVKTKTSNLVNK